MPIKLENQVIYKCQFCGKRALTKRGSIIHERSFCKHENSTNRKNCKHERIETKWTSGAPYEQVPAYDYCPDCGKKFE